VFITWKTVIYKIIKPGDWQQAREIEHTQNLSYVDEIARTSFRKEFQQPVLLGNLLGIELNNIICI
jgi:hypothetical protein